MHRDTLDLDFLFWSVLLVNLNGFHLCQCCETVVSKHMSKDRILPIQMRSLVKADEELTTIRRRSFICHTDNPSSVVAQRRSDLIFERLFPYRDSPLGLRWRSSSLDHEVGYQPVEERAIIIARCAKSQEVLVQAFSFGMFEGLGFDCLPLLSWAHFRKRLQA
jgi:hypothetical protein